MTQLTEHTQSADNNKVFVRRVGIVLALTLIALLLLGLLGAAFDVLLLILAATLIALPLQAGASWLSGRTKWPAGVSLAVVALLSIGLLIGMGWFISAAISSQVDQLQDEAPKAIDNAKDKLMGTSLGKRLLEEDLKPEKLLRGSSSGWLSRISGVVSDTLGSLANLYVVLFLSAFFAAQPNLYKQGFLLLIAKPGRERTSQVLDQLRSTLLGWLGGKIFSMAVVGVLTFVGLWLLGIPMAGALALFAGLISFIPNFGPIIALAPAVLFALLEGPDQALYVGLLYVGIQFVESNLLTPLVQQRVISLPPALVLIAQLLIGLFSGLLGIALATPIIAIIMVVVKMLYIQDVLKDDSVKV